MSKASKIKKLYSLSDEAIQRMETLQKSNPNLSASEIVEAIIMTIPDNAVIKRETKIEYTVNK